MISYNEKTNIFHISTEKSSYVMGLLADGILTHIYYGKLLKSFSCINLDYCNNECNEFTIDYSEEYPNISLTKICQEYPCFGGGDYRTPALSVIYDDFSRTTELVYSEHRIFKGKPNIKGLPHIYVDNDCEAETLEIILSDKYSDLKVILRYSIVDGCDAIIRSSEIINGSDNEIRVLAALSSSIDCKNTGYEITFLSGAWARERHIKKLPVVGGNFFVDSKRGSSSHALNPFVALSQAGATEDFGEVYGFNLIYSGNFIAGVESNDDTLRTYIGINPFDFCYILSPGESFQAPEAVLVYSACGFGEMSRTFHKLYRKNLCRKEFQRKSRPILVNHWEATYFDFNEQKILDIAKKAVNCGIDMMVLDDGWFGKRNDDTTSLGDWSVNLSKLPSGIEGLAKKINKLGMKFGLWFEPEMISPNSDLYTKHPDWCLHIEGRKRRLGRNQLILDLSRNDVCEYIFNTVSNILSSAKISYVKWDMNRNMSEVGSSKLEGKYQGEVAHRYMLGLYSILDRLVTEFPNVLFESSSGGGGRFDPGMMYYMSQGWVSDDSDAQERLYIQYGTSLVYPTSVMSAHVSAVPNHQVGRTTPLEMRGMVAMNGRLGYEMDLNKLNDEEIEIVKKQIKTYRKYEDIIHNGDLYRLLSPFESNMAAFQYISEDKNKVLLFYFIMKGIPNISGKCIKLRGLQTDFYYVNSENGQFISGEMLQNVGLILPQNRDNISLTYLFEKSDKLDLF